MIEAVMISLKRPHLVEEPDRHGNMRYYFRKGHGRRVRIREEPGSEEFDRRYHELLRQVAAGELRPEPRDAARPNTFRWLCQRYMASAEFRALDAETTQYVRMRILGHICTEPIAPGASETFGECPLAKFGPKAVRILRDRKSDTPEAGNARVKAIRAVFRWALDPGNEVEGVTANPARDVPFLKPRRVGGIPPWTTEDIAQYQRRHPVGTKARLAMELLINTGVRRSDVVRLGRQHIKDGRLSFTAYKGRNSTPVQLDLPILPGLRACLDAGPVGDLVFLVTVHGKPHTKNGYGGWFKRQCRLAGIEERSSHGLRKAASIVAAENGATAHELKAIFGWLTLKQAHHYTELANRKRLSANAARLLSRSEGEQNSLTSNDKTPPVRENGGTK